MTRTAVAGRDKIILPKEEKLNKIKEQLEDDEYFEDMLNSQEDWEEDDE